MAVPVEVADEAVGHGRRARPFVRPSSVALVLATSAAFAIKLGESQGQLFVPTSGAFPGRLLIVVTVYATAAVAVLATARVAPRRLPWRAMVLVAALLAGIAVGYGVAVGFDEMARMWRVDAMSAVTVPAGFLLMGLLGVALLLMDEQAREARRQLHEEQLRMIELARAADEARLAALQSQVEPHFLFNALAHVQHLYGSDPAAGRAMMRDLIGYLGDTQPALQRQAIPLREDAKLASTYLKLQQVRMGERLAYSFDIPDAAASAQVPPLTLTTLVENAVKHGLAPQPAGGMIRVSATADGKRVCIAVSDDGRGLQASFGSGIGLSNLRARLGLLHGEAARLELAEGRAGGATATVVVPHGPMESSC